MRSIIYLDFTIDDLIYSHIRIIDYHVLLRLHDDDTFSALVSIVFLTTGTARLPFYTRHAHLQAISRAYACAAFWIIYMFSRRWSRASFGIISHYRWLWLILMIDGARWCKPRDIASFHFSGILSIFDALARREFHAPPRRAFASPNIFWGFDGGLPPLHFIAASLADARNIRDWYLYLIAFNYRLALSAILQYSARGLLITADISFCRAYLSFRLRSDVISGLSILFPVGQHIAAEYAADDITFSFICFSLCFIAWFLLPPDFSPLTIPFTARSPLDSRQNARLSTRRLHRFAL